LLAILFSLTLAACSSSGSDETGSNAQNNAVADGDTQQGTDGQPGMDSVTSGENVAGVNTVAGTGTNNGGSTTDDGNTETGIPATDGNVSFWGTVNIDQSDQSADAFFVSNTQNLSATQIQNIFSPSSDTCQFSENTINTTPTGPQDTPFGPVNFNPVSAGDVITLTSPAGTFAELVKMDDGNFISYEIEGGGNLPGAVPAGTIVDIPGDVFPAFLNVAVPNVAALTNVTSSTGSTLTASTTVTWDASPGTGSYMNLNASSTILPDFTDPNIDLDSITVTVISVDCTILDDGSFSFPAEIAAQMGNNFMAENFNLSRSGFTFEQRGNALLTVNVTSSN